MPTIKVAMVGMKGAGKTSILSVMLADIKNFINRLAAANPELVQDKVRPDLTPENDQAHQDLADGRAQLRNLAMAARRSGADCHYTVDTRDGQIMGDVTDRCTPVVFSMGKEADRQVRIEFWDFPGMFYSQKQIDADQKKGWVKFDPLKLAQWESIVREADVILLAVDSSMQLGVAGQKPLLSDASYYTRISSLVRESIETSPTTLVFVPVKCEHRALAPKWDNEVESVDLPFSASGLAELRAQVEKLFPDLMEFVLNPENLGKVSALYAPMITVGGIRCSGTEAKVLPDGCVKASAKFSPALPEHYDATPFDPRNCDKVFAICLLNAYKPLVKAWSENLGPLNHPVEWILYKLFGHIPFAEFFHRLSLASGFYAMLARYVLDNPALLDAWERDESKSALLGFYKSLRDEAKEDGCTALNFVIPPMFA